MTNYVPINNTISRDIVRCFNSQYWHSVYIPGMATSPGDAKHGGVWGSASCVGVINLELQRQRD